MSNPIDTSKKKCQRCFGLGWTYVHAAPIYSMEYQEEPESADCEKCNSTGYIEVSCES